MLSVHIDRILEACIKRRASDIFLTEGRPPQLLIEGRLTAISKRSLNADDCVALIRSVTPDENQRELRESGGTRFRFAYGNDDRFRVLVLRVKDRISMDLHWVPYAA